MNSLKGKTIVITGASRGIGRAIALRCAIDGANIVVAAKTTEAHKTLPGTIFSVASEIEAAGGQALPLKLDVRDHESLEAMAKSAAEKFGGIDILINNAGAIKLTTTDATPPKSYDLMNSVNSRAAFFATRACLPYLEKSDHAHVLNMSPPISLDPKWLENHVAYTISKYGMTLCTLGMAAEFRDRKIAVNSLWPKTAIATAAISWIMGKDAIKHCRKAQIVADAAHALFLSKPTEISGQCLLDEDFLRSKGVADFDIYACEAGQELYRDFYVDG